MNIYRTARSKSLWTTRVFLYVLIPLWPLALLVLGSCLYPNAANAETTARNDSAVATLAIPNQDSPLVERPGENSPGQPSPSSNSHNRGIDLTFVVDTSQRMKQSLPAAKLSLIRAFSELRPTDRVRLIRSGSRTLPITDGFLPATPANIATLSEIVDRFNAYGEADLRTAVEQVGQPTTQGVKRRLQTAEHLKRDHRLIVVAHPASQPIQALLQESPWPAGVTAFSLALHDPATSGRTGNLADDLTSQLRSVLHRNSKSEPPRVSPQD